MVQERQSPPVWAELLITTFTLAGTALLVWGQLPPQEREWIRLGVAQYRLSLQRRMAARAWQAGRAGMAEEIKGHDPSPWYTAAVMWGRLRDRLGR